MDNFETFMNSGIDPATSTTNIFQWHRHNFHQEYCSKCQ